MVPVRVPVTGPVQVIVTRLIVEVVSMPHVLAGVIVVVAGVVPCAMHAWMVTVVPSEVAVARHESATESVAGAE